MKYILVLILISFQVLASPTSSADINNQKNKELLKRIVEEELTMNADKMKDTLRSLNIEFEQNNNAINYTIQGYRMTIIYDVNADRMRIVCPIVKVEDITKDHIKQAMEANYHTALDARYAISNDIVWAVFIHPLSDLSEKLFRSALEQILYTAATFGKEYSSGTLNFPKQESQEPSQENKSEDPYKKDDKKNK
ncbi:MAG: type III secretion system chaperone [Alcanivoracaceae bacterium]|nr:type III secretion system chaperone [Alcanivoracaceae bacterium]